MTLNYSVLTTQQQSILYYIPKTKKSIIIHKAYISRLVQLCQYKKVDIIHVKLHRQTQNNNKRKKTIKHIHFSELK